MYAGYNQYELKGVRIGNWVDEAALLEATGHNRGPRPGEPDFGIDNPERVIGAPGATHPKDWQSDYQAGFIDHTGRDNYRPMPDHGQREAMRRQAVAKRVEEEMAAEEMEETRRRDSFAGMETVAQASYLSLIHI